MFCKCAKKHPRLFLSAQHADLRVENRGVRTTAQFNAKIYYPKADKKEHLWASDNISHFTFSPDKYDIKSDNCSMELSEDGKTYIIKSTMSKKCTVNLKITQTVPGFVVGKNGTSNFGTDPAKPWGRMRHAFWPRCQVEGSMMTPEGPVDFKGRAMYSHALQGMKPHFAAAKWNFCNFQSPTYSAILMQYTTPPAYGETVVAVGGIVTDEGVLMAGASPALRVQHTEVKGDPDNDWPEPGAVTFTWEGQSKDGKEVKAELGGKLTERTDRVDVMGELPKFVKQIVAGTAGTKPYIYQYTPKLTLKLNVGGEQKEEEGQLFMEATFIT